MISLQGAVEQIAERAEGEAQRDQQKKGVPQPEIGTDKVYEATVLVPGVFTPGMGPNAGMRVLFPPEVLQTMAESMNGKKVNLEHKQDIESEVGFVRNARWQDDRIKADLVIQKKRAKFLDAVSFIEGRLDADQVPEVSVEIRQEVFEDAPAGAPYDLVLRGGVFDGVSVLPSGACSPDAGCGIGMHNHDDEDEVVHYHRAIASVNPTANTSDGSIVLVPDGWKLSASTSLNESESNPPQRDGQEVTPMSDDKAGDCSCKGAGLQEKLAELETKLGEREEKIEQLTEQLDEHKNIVDQYQAAEREVKVEALQSAYGEDVDLSEVLGAPVDEATLRDMDIALRSAKTMSGTGMQPEGNGRKTTMAPRDGESNPNTYMQTMREALGLGDVDLPRTFKVNNARVAAKGGSK